MQLILSLTLGAVLGAWIGPEVLRKCRRAGTPTLDRTEQRLAVGLGLPLILGSLVTVTFLYRYFPMPVVILANTVTMARMAKLEKAGKQPRLRWPTMLSPYAALLLIALITYVGLLESARHGGYPARDPSMCVHLWRSDALPLLESAITDASPAVRREVVEELSKIPGQRSEAILVGALKDHDPMVRAKAAESLGAGAYSALPGPSLVELLGDRSGAVSSRARLALSSLGTKAHPVLRWTVRDGEETSSDVLPLEGPAEMVRVRSSLGDRWPAVRLEAMRLLAGRADRETVRSFLVALRDPDPRARDIAVQALSMANRQLDPRTAKLLAEAMRDPEPAVRGRALLAARSLPGPTMAALIRELREGPGAADPLIRDALRFITRPSVEALVAELGGDQSTATAAVTALARIGTPAVRDLTAALDREPRTQEGAALALSRIGDPFAIPALEAADHKPYPNGRCPLCRAAHALREQ